MDILDQWEKKKEEREGKEKEKKKTPIVQADGGLLQSPEKNKSEKRKNMKILRFSYDSYDYDYLLL